MIAPIGWPPYDIPFHAPDAADIAAAQLPLTDSATFVPCPANYLGGNIVSAILSTDMHRMSDGSALLDLESTASW